MSDNSLKQIIQYDIITRRAVQRPGEICWFSYQFPGLHLIKDLMKRKRCFAHVQVSHISAGMIGVIGGRVKLNIALRSRIN